MICNMRVNAAILTVYRDIFAGGEKFFFDHFFARPGRPGKILKCFFKIKPWYQNEKKKLFWRGGVFQPLALREEWVRVERVSFLCWKREHSNYFASILAFGWH